MTEAPEEAAVIREDTDLTLPENDFIVEGGWNLFFVFLCLAVIVCCFCRPF